MESSTPAKPQPLHNFDLPDLKWNTDGNSSGGNHHRRRSIKSPRPMLSASPIRQSSSHDSVSAPPQRRPSPILPNPSPIRVESLQQFWSGHSSPETEGSRKDNKVNYNPILRNQFSRNSASSGSIFRFCSSEKVKDKIDEKEKLKAPEEEGDGIKRSKILIKIPRFNKTIPDGEKSPKIVVDKNGEHVKNNPKIAVDNNGEHGEKNPKIGDDNSGEHGGLTDEVDEETRVWNLRPRKPKSKSKNAIVDTGKTEKAEPPLKNTNKSGEKDGEKEKKEKKEKKKLSICILLTKEEIDDDIYALTGSKPSRRPKKRAKNVQKNLDSVFPGQWLVSISPDSYKVSANYMKD